jgi:addiction module RelB/DinJ family antitoxin
MTATNMNISFGGELEARAQSILADLGLDVPTAINIFLTQVVETKTLPFDLRVEKKPKMTREEAFGCARGQSNIPDDFDEPMDIIAVTEKKPKMSREEMFDCARGQFNIPDDFDEPLEDFREYME